jgi:regulatory protein
VPVVTAVRENRRGGVAVELDGAPWRVLPVDVVVRAGVTEGRLLDRAALRVLRRELRRAEALRIAGRTLRSRDLSRRRVEERLARAAVPPAAATDSVETLERAGLLDDRRACQIRAQALAERRYGNELIRHRLREEGFEPGQVEEAVGALNPETERARAVIKSRGLGPRTARYLAARGFGEEAVEAALGAAFGQDT